MAGHSAWKNIKHKKAAADAKRGKAWSKCVRAIIMAAKAGGGDPDANISLRAAIDEARYHNVPRDTIENAIKKATGELGKDNYEAVIYEGYGPGGVAILLEIYTDNRNRTAPEVKAIFDKNGGNLGAKGCVSHIFQSVGQVMVNKAGASEEAIMNAALEAGANDVVEEGELWRIDTPANLTNQVRKALEAAGFKVESAAMTMLPNQTVTVTGDIAQKVVSLVEALDDNEDVQKVHANFEIPDAELAALR